jgi:hypothetical protein
MLYEAAQSMLRSKKWSWLKAWAMKIARHRGMKKAIRGAGASVGSAGSLWIAEELGCCASG